MKVCGLCLKIPVTKYLDYGYFCKEHIKVAQGWEQDRQKRMEDFRIYLSRKCLDCSGPQQLCHYHISDYTSEYFLCQQCYEDEGKEVKGTHRYDSLVLCDKHNEPMPNLIKQLNAIFDNNPNVTRITNLGLN
jgi:hypothetical protein